MTGERDIERVLDHWFEDGPSEIADRVVDRALLTIDTTTQTRGALRLPRRFTMNGTMRLAAITLAAVAVVAIGASLFNSSPPGNVGGLSTSSPAQPSASPPASPTAAASPSAAAPVLPAGAIVVEHFGGQLDGGSPKPDENSTTRLWVVTGGAGAHEVLPDRLGSQGGPAWSADGTRLAFTELGAVEKIYVANAAGAAPELLETACTGECDDNAVSFSPDGKRIAFRRVLFGSGRGVEPTSSVVATMVLATGKVDELRSTEVTFADDHAANGFPRWSPDGTQLLFYRWTIGSDGVPTGSALFLVDADGENLREIAAPPFAGDAEWSPDGSTIAFGTYPWHADRMGDVPAWGVDRNVYTVQPDGTDLVQLTTDGFSSAPSWTSEGRILFVRGPLNNGFVASNLWLMDADGGNQVQITEFVRGPGGCCSFYAAVQPTP
jgi:dipeptidyl aminopeptidase/acylaminoacyl peptidase